MKRIQLRNRVQMGDYKCMDLWDQEVWVDDHTTQQGELTQFYRGGYTLFMLAKSEYRYVNQ